MGNGETTIQDLIKTLDKIIARIELTNKIFRRNLKDIEEELAKYRKPKEDKMCERCGAIMDTEIDGDCDTCFACWREVKGE